jgi:glycosyltransferase involved in cell wall biosynthesis
MRPSKRPEILLDLAERFPNLRFTMIAPMAKGHESYRQGLEQRAARLENVTFIDYVPVDQIHDYFADCDLLVQTSEYEGFPNVLLQAWSAGRPVLTSFDPDGVVRRYGLGYVAQERAQLESILRTLVQGDAVVELRQFGANARGYIERYHAADVVMPELCRCLGLLSRER